MEQFALFDLREEFLHYFGPHESSGLGERTQFCRMLRELDRDITDEKLNECHTMICPDLSLRDFVSEYKMLQNYKNCSHLKRDHFLLRAFKSFSLSSVL